MVLRRLAYYGETWLAEHFNAYLADPDEHRAWRSGERSCSPAPRPDTCPGFGRFRDDDDRQHPPSPHRLSTRPKTGSGRSGSGTDSGTASTQSSTRTRSWLSAALYPALKTR